MNDGLHVYTSRHKIDYPWYLIVDVIKNICRRSNLLEEFCISSFKSQVLPLQVYILYNFLHHAISPHMGPSDKVTCLDVALLDSIFISRKPNMGYIII